MDARKVRQIREEMERAEARRLQPHFIASFHQEAFAMLGGQLKGREPKRFEITHVPAIIRNRDRQIGVGRPVLTRYERVTFEKELISVPGKPLAEFICPGHPLLDATIDIVLERHRDLLKRGAVLVDPADAGENVRVHFYLEHAIQDSRTDRDGNRRVVSRRLQFVEVDSTGVTRPAGPAPYLDDRPATDEERALVGPHLEEPWLKEGLEDRALSFAVASLVPGHLDEVRKRKEELAGKTLAAVKERLTKEITYWDHRAQMLRAKEQAGKESDKLNSAKARQRADELQARLQQRLTELEQERKALAPAPRGHRRGADRPGGPVGQTQRKSDRLPRRLRLGDREDRADCDGGRHGGRAAARPPAPRRERREVRLRCRVVGRRGRAPADDRGQGARRGGQDRHRHAKRANRSPGLWVERRGWHAAGSASPNEPSTSFSCLRSEICGRLPRPRVPERTQRPTSGHGARRRGSGDGRRFTGCRSGV
jgi:hypothetical protein